MPAKRIDLNGRIFGRLTVLSFSHSDEHRTLFWNCRCECGNERAMRSTSLLRGVESCGCYRGTRKRHDKALVANHATPEANTWYQMVARCTRQHNHAWPRYGGRGIKICDRWLNGDGVVSGLECFILDMGQRPAEHSLDRIDNDGNYEPANCRWASAKAQGRNQRKTVWVDYKGRRVSLAEAVEVRGLNYMTAYNRIKRYGWPVDVALSEPARPKNAPKFKTVRA